MLEDDAIYLDAETAADGEATIDLFLLFQAVLAYWPRPTLDGVLLPGYPEVLTWGTN
jgi:hypothetical protein